MEFFKTKSFWPHCGSGVDSASNRNEYQEYFVGSKGGRCVGLTTLPPSCADCLEIWEPQLPETPVLACLDTALPFTHLICVIKLKMLRWTGHVTRMERIEMHIDFLVGKLKRKRPFGKHRRISGDVDNIKMDIKKQDSSICDRCC